MSSSSSILPSPSGATPTDTAPPPSAPSIQVLPREVVDQIAAGEVVQRPASVVKELLENCIDAGSTSIVVRVEKGGLSKIKVSDDGSGIPRKDLGLAATRHATSKLGSVTDFATLQTFGFRGEALASISMVSRLTVTSRTRDSPVAFSQDYRNGLPAKPQPTPCARKPGTTLLVEDLFHNVPHRLRAYRKRESDEYHRILGVVQHYAIHYPRCGFCLERTTHGAVVVDVHTGRLPPVRTLLARTDPPEPERIAATKAVVAHVLEPGLEQHLRFFSCRSDDDDAGGSEPPGETAGTGLGGFTYRAEVYFTPPGFCARKAHFLLFLNDRLVDSPALKRTLEDAYGDFSSSSSSSSKTNKPVLVVSVWVPGSQVDVNVHPSKRRVALVYQEELCQALAARLKEGLQGLGQTFRPGSVTPQPKTKARAATPTAPEPPAGSSSSSSSKRRREDPDPGDGPADSEPPPPGAPQPKRKTPSNHKPTPPSRLIRTSKAAPVGAIEPFLVSTQPATPPTGSGSTAPDAFPHKPGCPLADLDLSRPGAFALRCTCAPPETVGGTVLVKRPVVRPKRVVPTRCSYSSVGSLRKRVNKRTSPELARQLREAHFVGLLSPFRSLIQCGEHLTMIHHSELAKELFYQLALARFGGPLVAELGDGGVDGIRVTTILAQVLQLEDDLVLLQQHHEPPPRSQLDALGARDGLLDANETNRTMAEQATACLWDHAEMLEEYFGIRLEQDPENREILLTGLPVLLDGHSPEPHGLSIFLLRLATQVDWEEERPCFHGVCRELGNYYALLPTREEEKKAHVQHILFPAISYLLLPSERHKTDSNFSTMTKLSTLYKVFERC